MRLNKYLSALILLIMTWCDPSWAQDSINSLNDTLKYFPLEEVSIQSVRADKEVPVSETTLNQKEIEQNYAGQEMPVTLSKTPAVTWYSDGGNFTGYSYLRLRGIDQTRINFTLNGVPLNEPEDQGAYFSNYPDFLNSVRSIQVQRGVGISTNGTASFGGSVNMESPSLADSAYTELNTSYGSFNTYRMCPEFNTGILTNKWAFYGRYSLTASDGFREHSGTQGQSFFFSGAYFAKRGIVKLSTFTGNSKNQMAYLAVPDSTLKQNYRANPLTQDEKDEFTQSLVMLQYIVPVKRYSFLSLTGYSNFLSGGYDILFAPDMYNFSVKSKFYGVIANYQYQRKKIKINTGMHGNTYRRYHYASVEPYQSNELYRNSGEKKEFALFFKLSYELKKFIFFSDVQYRVSGFTYHPDVNTSLPFQPISWHFINPKAGISYEINNRHILYTSFGQTSREPTRNDMFAGYDNIDIFNYDEIGSFSKVKPESVTDLELGTKISFAKFKIDANVYSMEFRNEIAAIGQLSYIGLPLRKNVSSSYRRGLEITVSATPLKKLTLLTQAGLSENRIKEYTTDYDSITYTKIQPLLSPGAIINQTIQYNLLSWLQIEVNGRYTSASFLDNTNNKNHIIPSSLIVNTALSLSFKKQLSFTLMVNNLTDAQYYTSGYTQNGTSHFYPMATRNYSINLKLRF